MEIERVGFVYLFIYSVLAWGPGRWPPKARWIQEDGKLICRFTLYIQLVEEKMEKEKHEDAPLPSASYPAMILKR